MSHSKKILAAPVVLILLGVAFYFLYFIKTPSYAVNEIRSAVEQRDAVKFQQYVDVDTVLDKAFEDLLLAESKIQNDSIMNNPFALGVIHMIKPAVVNLMKQQALESIDPSLAKKDKKAPEPVSDAMRINMIRKAQLDKLTYKGLKLEQENAEKATLNVFVTNTKLQKDFAFNLAMLKNKDGKWQVKEISNLAAIVMQFDAAEKAKRASENQQVLNRLKQHLSVNDKKLTVTMVKASELAEKVVNESNAAGTTVPTLSANVVDEDKLEPCLTSKILFKNISNTTILRAYYDVEILDKDKKPIYSYPEHYDGSLAPNTAKEVVAIKRLNQQLPDDRALVAKKDQDLECNITVTYIAFEDGSVIEPNQYVQY